jgi:predicted lipoprotein
VAFAAAVALLAAACGGDGSPRGEVMDAVASDVAIPAFERFAADAAAVVDAADAACATPDLQTIAGARAAVDTARASWLATHAVRTGPALDRRSVAQVDWTASMDDVTALVDGSAPGELTVDVVSGSVGADSRGLRALVGVLAADDVVERLGDEGWCDYIAAVAGAVAAESTALVDAWTVDAGDGEPFTDDIAADPQEWLGMLVNENIQLVRMVAAGPRGDSEVPIDLAADAAAELTGVARVVDALAPLLGDDLHTRLAGEVDDAIAAFEAGDVEEGRRLTGEVDKTMTTDVAGRLDVTIGFSDADGDGSG